MACKNNYNKFVIYSFLRNFIFCLLLFMQYHTITFVVDSLHDVPNIHYRLATNGKAFPHADTISDIESYHGAIPVNCLLRDILFALASTQNKNADCEK